MDPARDSRRGPRSALSTRAPFAARIRRWLRPPRILRPTRAGWCFFVVIFAVGFAALNTGNNLLYLVLSLMLAFLALSGVLSESALRGIEVNRLLPSELFAGRENPVRLEIRNRQRHVPAFAVVVEDRYVAREATHPSLDDEVAPAGRVFVLRVDPGGTQVRGYHFSPAKRGPLLFAGFRVSTRFPFGLFVKSMILPGPKQTLVYPAVEILPVPPLAAGRREVGRSDVPERVEGPMVAGLREFQDGDLLRRVHWKASLRRAKLLVRELEDDLEPEVEVQLRTGGHDPGDAFEKRVRWAASEFLAHLEAGLRVALRTDSERIAPGSGPRHRAAGLSFLALVKPESANATAASRS